jgi:hypothetical protein
MDGPVSAGSFSVPCKELFTGILGRQRNGGERGARVRGDHADFGHLARRRGTGPCVLRTIDTTFSRVDLAVAAGRASSDVLRTRRASFPRIDFAVAAGGASSDVLRARCTGFSRIDLAVAAGRASSDVLRTRVTGFPWIHLAVTAGRADSDVLRAGYTSLPPDRLCRCRRPAGSLRREADC